MIGYLLSLGIISLCIYLYNKHNNERTISFHALRAEEDYREVTVSIFEKIQIWKDCIAGIDKTSDVLTIKEKQEQLSFWLTYKNKVEAMHTAFEKLKAKHIHANLDERYKIYKDWADYIHGERVLNPSNADIVKLSYGYPSFDSKEIKLQNNAIEYRFAQATT